MFRMLPLILLAACTSEPPANPQPGTVSWATWQDYSLGLTLDYPDTWEESSYGDAHRLTLRNQGYPVLSVSHLSESEAAYDGLWGRNESDGEGFLAGKPAVLYAYDHAEPLTTLPTRSWVIPWSGKFLALEFRVRGGQLDSVQQAMLSRVRLAEPKPVP